MRPALGVNVTFAGDRVYFTRTDVASMDAFVDSLPVWQRIRSVVRTGPQTLAAIASELNYSKSRASIGLSANTKTSSPRSPGAMVSTESPLSSGGPHEPGNLFSAAPRHHNRSIGTSACTDWNRFECRA